MARHIIIVEIEGEDPDGGLLSSALQMISGWVQGGQKQGRYRPLVLRDRANDVKVGRYRVVLDD